jgi:hypothetical protein
LQKEGELAVWYDCSEYVFRQQFLLDDIVDLPSVLCLNLTIRLMRLQKHDNSEHIYDILAEDKQK